MATTAVPNIDDRWDEPRRARRRRAGSGRRACCSGIRRPCGWSCGTARRSDRRTVVPARCACTHPTRCAASCGARTSSASARAYVVGDLDADGDIFELVAALRGRLPDGQAASCCGSLPRRPCARRGASVPRAARCRRRREEARLHGGRHSLRRDAGGDRAPLRRRQRLLPARARAVDDVLVRPLRRRRHRPHGGPGGQARSHRRKLGLDALPGGRLLDVGCGWGSMAIHAASHYDVTVVGITISEAQAALARERVAEAGLQRPRRDPPPGLPRHRRETFDAISSIGMSEHVGHDNLARYYELLHAALRPGGRLLNHAISSVGGSKLGRTLVHRALRVPRRRADRRRRERAGDGTGRVRGARRRVAARALRPHAAGVGRQPRGGVGRRGRHGRRSRGRASGGCTWPARRSGSRTTASPSTRCSASCRPPTGRAACRRRGARSRR